MLQFRLYSVVIIALVFTIILCLLDNSHFNGLETEEHIHERIINRLYFTMTTVSTVGYGDITPRSIPCRIITMLLMLIVTIGVANTIIESMQTNNAVPS